MIFRARHLISLLILAGIAAFIINNEIQFRRFAQREVARHARVVAEPLWNINTAGPRAYVDQAMRNNNYELFLIKTDRGKVFLRSEGESLHGNMEKLLSRLGLMPLVKLSSSVVHKGEVIGEVEVDARIKTIYSDLYALVVGLLILLAVRLYIGLLKVNNNLESRVRERTEELAASEAKNRELVEQSPIGLALCTMDGTPVSVNPAYAKIIGHTIEDALKLSYWHLTPEKYLEDEKRQLEQLEAIGRYGPYEKEYFHKDGHLVPVRLNGMIVVRDDNEYIWSSVEDITSLRKAEQEKAELTERLRQAQKMEAIGTLAGGIAHDFNNILSAVFGYTELTLRNPNCDHKSRSNLNQILSAASRARDLVKQILMFSKKADENREPLQIHLVIEEAVSLINKTIPSTVAINLDINQNTGMVLANATQIHQVVMNLCTNAYHSLPEQGGNIDISLQPVDVDHVDAAQNLNLRKGRYAQFTVTDTGSGMTQLTISRIFDPFFTTKPQGKGTGMGLALVHGIVQHHDGVIDVESEVGKGTTFKVFFPLTTDTAAEEKCPVERPPDIEGDEHILFVDDEPMLAELGSESLKSFGYKVTSTTSAKEALELFQTNPDNYNLIVTDQTMPEISGDILAKRVISIRSDIPVIICTGHSAVLNAEKAQAIGVKALLMKPLEQDKLVKTVRKILDERA
jgi:PAS domain S-box-containing protein